MERLGLRHTLTALAFVLPLGWSAVARAIGGEAPSTHASTPTSHAPPSPDVPSAAQQARWQARARAARAGRTPRTRTRRRSGAQRRRDAAIPLHLRLQPPRPVTAEAAYWLRPEVIAKRAEAARHHEADLAPQLAPEGTTAPEYMVGYEAGKAAALELQRRFPDLVRVEIFGESCPAAHDGQPREMYVVVLTNRAVPGPKPVAHLVAGEHARELAPPAVLAALADYATMNHGVDPDVTMMLDSTETHLVFAMNPSGTLIVERGFARLPGGNTMQRKNARGVDGNRQWPWLFGGVGSSNDPRAENYHGPFALSEGETKSFDAWQAAHPAKLLWTLHSYGPVNLYPRGDSHEHAPDHEALQAQSYKTALHNQASVMQGVDLYPTTGTIDDDAYFRRHAMAQTLEIGDSFQPTAVKATKIIRANLAALLYAMRITPDPYVLVHGPDAFDFRVDPASKTVTARVAHGAPIDRAIAGAELVFDRNTPPGQGVPLHAQDGAFDSVDEHVTGSLEGVRGLSAAANALIYVRARDTKGNWGPLSAQWLNGPPARGARRPLPHGA